MTPNSSEAGAPPLRRSTMLLYGLGSASNGIKNRSIATFLLIFYGQVIGLPATWIGSALAITLVIDGLLDPVIGQVSDNFRSRWGRRHPFMYAAAIPYAIVFAMLWMPPVGWSPEATLGYMITCIVVLRFVDTFFEVPASAMAAELTTDYHQRTLLVAYRYFFTFAGGLLLLWAAYTFFLDEKSGGLFIRSSYGAYGIVAAVVIATSILICAIGTHSRIPTLRQPPSRKATPKVVLREVIETLSNRSLWTVNAAGLFVAVATGLVGGLSTYFQVYFWHLTPKQLSYLPIIGIVAALLGILIGPQITKRLGKRRGAIVIFGALALASTLPVSLRLMGVLPPNGSPDLFPILIAEALAVGALTLMGAMAITSMIVDVAEDSELKTGRRSEGLLVSVDNVLKKTTAGVGVFAASLVLTAAGLSDRISPDQVSDANMAKMGLAYVPAIWVIYVGAILSLLTIRLDEAKHEDNLRILREKRSGSGG